MSEDEVQGGLNWPSISTEQKPVKDYGTNRPGGAAPANAVNIPTASVGREVTPEAQQRAAEHTRGYGYDPNKGSK